MMENKEAISCGALLTYLLVVLVSMPTALNIEAISHHWVMSALRGMVSEHCEEADFLGRACSLSASHRIHEGAGLRSIISYHFRRWLSLYTALHGHLGSCFFLFIMALLWITISRISSAHRLHPGVPMLARSFLLKRRHCSMILM